jgi:hypothetical protein
MDKSIPNFDFVNQLENLIRDFLKEKLEFIMKEEIQNFLKVKQTHIHSSKKVFTNGLLIRATEKLKIFLFLETEMETSKPNYSSLINCEMVD